METQNLPPLTKSQERALIVGLILLGWALVVVFRLFLLQVFEHDEYVRAAHRQQQQVEAMQAQRGSIFDRNGTLLAISSASNIVFVNPSRIPTKDIAAALVARILHMDAPRLQRSLEAAAKSKRHSGYLIIDNNVTDQQAAGLKGMNLDWLGI